jgi:hypothetical protein
MYTPSGYRVHFVEHLPEGKAIVFEDQIHVPESMAYKFIFLNDRVDDVTVGIAIAHATQKLNRFIDRL